MLRKILTDNRTRMMAALAISLPLTIFISNYLGKTIPYRPNQIAYKITQGLSQVPQLLASFTIKSSTPTPSPVAINRTPTIKFTGPSPISNNIKPTAFIANITPINKKIIPTLTLKPTVKPTIKPTVKPTAVPTKKPTAVPPTPTPEIVIGTVRPGSNRDEVADIAGGLACVPPALLKAINDVETNGLKRVADYFELINTYGWWNDGSTDTFHICQGFAYNTCTGVVPSDSNAAGYHCTNNPAGICSYDIKIMGPMQLSESEQNAYLSKAKTIMKQDTVDRRVIFDSFLISALHFKNISLYRDSDCTNWPVENIFRTACKYYGGCNYNVNGNSGNYCQKVCEGYNSYAGTSYNCENNYSCN